MRQLKMIFITLVLLSGSAFAAESESQELKSIQIAKVYSLKIEQESQLSGKMAEFQNLRSDIRKFFDSIPNPEKVLFLNFHHPLLKNVRSMSEFEGYIDLVNIKNLSDRSTCEKEAQKLSQYSRSMKDESTQVLLELYWAQKVVSAFCR